MPTSEWKILNIHVSTSRLFRTWNVLVKMRRGNSDRVWTGRAVADSFECERVTKRNSRQIPNHAFVQLTGFMILDNHFHTTTTTTAHAPTDYTNHGQQSATQRMSLRQKWEWVQVAPAILLFLFVSTNDHLQRQWRGGKPSSPQITTMTNPDAYADNDQHR